MSNTQIPFKPLGNTVLLEKVTIQEKKVGSLIVSGGKKATTQHSNLGRIVALGSTAFQNSNCELPEEDRPKIGDVVHFDRYQDNYINHSTESTEQNHFIIVFDCTIRVVEL